MLSPHPCPRRWLKLRAAATLSFTIPLTALGASHESSRGWTDKLREGPGVVNHPVHVAPSSAVRIPKDWPLDANGTITCTTCHAGLPDLGGPKGAPLRGGGNGSADPQRFCSNCHSEDGQRTAAGMHWLALPRAHMMPETDRSSAGSGLLDAESRRCLECHDGVTAGESAYQTKWNRGDGAIGDKQRNHPVGVRYSFAPSRPTDSRLRPPSMLPPVVRLPGGNVSCLSCHNLYGREPNRLTVPIEGSALCFTCHDMN